MAEGDLLLRSQIDVFAYGNSRVDGKGIFFLGQFRITPLACKRLDALLSQ